MRALSRPASGPCGAWSGNSATGKKLDGIGDIFPPRAVALETLAVCNVAQTFTKTNVTFYTRLGAVYSAQQQQPPA